VKQEAVWALSNCTASASVEQFEYLVKLDMIKGLSSCLKLDDARILAVTLEGLSNIFLCGKKYYLDVNGFNMFAVQFEIEGYLNDLEDL
jgi:hypothetical protein